MFLQVLETAAETTETFADKLNGNQGVLMFAGVLVIGVVGLVVAALLAKKKGKR